MKKLIFSAAALTILLASCAKDEAVVTSSEALVTFNVAASQIGTRVYGDGITANDLEYAIYEKGSYAQPLIVKSIDGAFADKAMSTTFSEKLVKGKTYIALFWADAENDPYEIDWTKQTVKIADPAALKAQDENLDAFFKAHEIVVGQEAQEETVELTRPFAQLNIGTSDTEAARIAGLVVEQTEVSVRAYTTLNLLNGEVADAMQLTYALNEIPSGENATFTVKEKTYDHLSMNYLLVNKQELVTVDFTVNDGTSDINTSTFAQVPVERNYKTFIVGELLTSDVNFEVYILPDWKTPDYIWPDENGGEGGNENDGVISEDINVFENASELGEITSDGFFTIRDKHFTGTVTLDKGVEGSSGRYSFINVTFDKPIKVTGNLTIAFEDVTFKSTPAVIWSNSNTSDRMVMIKKNSCYVNDTLITNANVDTYFPGKSAVVWW